MKGVPISNESDFYFLILTFDFLPLLFKMWINYRTSSPGTSLHPQNQNHLF
jgi:hypothetical protein